jgi:hypothetical protein
VNSLTTDLQIVFRDLPMQRQIVPGLFQGFFDHRPGHSQATIIAKDRTDRCAGFYAMLCRVIESDLFKDPENVRIDRGYPGFVKRPVLPAYFARMHGFRGVGQRRTAQCFACLSSTGSSSHIADLF